MISGPFSENNLRLLRQHHPQTYNHLTKLISPLPFHLVSDASSQGPVYLTDTHGKTFLLHENPAEEAATFVSKVPEKDSGVVVMLGMGLGYAPTAIVQARRELQRLILFEPHPEIFLLSLAFFDLAPLLCDQRVILHVSPKTEINDQTLRTALPFLQTEDCHILRHLPSFHLDPAGYQHLHDQVFAFCNRLNIGGSTIMERGALFLENRIKNLSSIHHNLLLDHLAGQFTDIPAILIAAGPSLDQNIHLLKGQADKALLIALDSALPALVQHGITPHFTVSLDPLPIVYEKIADCHSMAPGTNLICQLMVNPRVPKFFPAHQVFWAFADNNFEQFINRSLGGRLSIREAHNNAHLAFIAALLMEASPIVFIGHDLALKKESDHARGAILSGRSFGNEILPENDPNNLWIHDIHGQRQITTRSLWGTKHHFETLISAHPGTYINATEGGAGINGTEIMPLNRVLQRWCKKTRPIGARLRRLTGQACQDITPLLAGLGELCTKGSKLQQELIAGLKIGRATIKEYTALRAGDAPTSFAELPSRLQEHIRAIDTANGRLDAARDFWALLDEITLPLLRDLNRRQTEINLLARDGHYDRWLAETLGKNYELNRGRLRHLIFFLRRISKLTEQLHTVASLEKLQRQNGTPEAGLALIRQYMASDDCVLAAPIIRSLVQPPAKITPELALYAGIIAARQYDHRQAELFFVEAHKDPAISRRLDDFLQAFGRQADDLRGWTALLLRILRICPDHQSVWKQIDNSLLDHVTLLHKSFTEGRTDWPKQADSLAAEIISLSDINPRLVKRTYRASSLFFTAVKQESAPPPDRTAPLFRQAFELATTKQLHDFFILLLDHGSFPPAISALQLLVERDNRFADYWEEIGDYLANANLPAEALIAYQRCFLIRWDKKQLLRKIADCYLAQNNLEAAHETLRILRQQNQQTPDLIQRNPAPGEATRSIT